MTPIQIEMALALNRAALYPGSNTKRFVRDMASRACQPDPKPITDKQHIYLCQAVVRFRRQVSAGLVEQAASMLEAANKTIDSPDAERQRAAETTA